MQLTPGKNSKGRILLVFRLDSTIAIYRYITPQKRVYNPLQPISPLVLIFTCPSHISTSITSQEHSHKPHISRLIGFCVMTLLPFGNTGLLPKGNTFKDGRKIMNSSILNEIPCQLACLLYSGHHRRPDFVYVLPFRNTGQQIDTPCKNRGIAVFFLIMRLIREILLGMIETFTQITRNVLPFGNTRH